MDPTAKLVIALIDNRAFANEEEDYEMVREIEKLLIMLAHEASEPACGMARTYLTSMNISLERN